MNLIDPYDLSYARWDGKKNKLETRLCYLLFKISLKKLEILFTFHPLHQYPFGIHKPSRLIGIYVFGVRMFWFQLEIQKDLYEKRRTSW